MMLEQQLDASSLNTKQNWWGEIELDTNTTRSWDFGTMKMSITSLQREWQVRYRYFDLDVNNELNAVKTRKGKTDLGDSDNYQRIVFGETGRAIQIDPVLPDRNLVTKPSVPVSIMPNESIILYVSVALWLRISDVRSHATLLEFPVRQLSDTWFGRNTVQGSLCYASKTSAMIDPASVELKPYRATVPVVISNEDDAKLQIEKINLPITSLELRQSDKGLFWASGVRFVKSQGSDDIKLSTGVDPAHDTAFKSWDKIMAPRSPMQDRLVTRAFDMFFS